MWYGQKKCDNDISTIFWKSHDISITIYRRYDTLRAGWDTGEFWLDSRLIWMHCHVCAYRWVHTTCVFSLRGVTSLLYSRRECHEWQIWGMHPCVCFICIYFQVIDMYVLSCKYRTSVHTESLAAEFSLCSRDFSKHSISLYLLLFLLFLSWLVLSPLYLFSSCREKNGVFA